MRLTILELTSELFVVLLLWVNVLNQVTRVSSFFECVKISENIAFLKTQMLVEFNHIFVLSCSNFATFTYSVLFCIIYRGC